MPDKINEEVEDSNGDSTENNNGNSSETNNTKETPKINFPTLKEAETWEEIREKLVQASFLEKPFKVFEEVSNNLIPNMNDNVIELNNKIDTFNEDLDQRINNRVSKLIGEYKLKTSNILEEHLVCSDTWSEL